MAYNLTAMSEQLSTEKKTTSNKKNISCSSCGQQIAVAARFCNFCGKEQCLVTLPAAESAEFLEEEILNKLELLNLTGAELAQIAKALPLLVKKESGPLLLKTANKYLLALFFDFYKKNFPESEYEKILTQYLSVAESSKLDLFLAAAPWLNQSLAEIVFSKISADQQPALWRLLKLYQLSLRDKFKVTKDNFIAVLEEAERPEFIDAVEKL